MRFQTGLISSALEHAVPEQMFSDPDNPTDGVSAVKALQLAAQEGQRIYQIDSSNLNTVLSQINLEASTEDEIRSYVMNGRIAIAHSNNISVPGWTGAGYILLDQATGVGSYKITGGGNGGFFQNLFSIILGAAAFFPALAAFIGPLILIALSIAVVGLAFANTLDSLDGCAGDVGYFFAFISAVLAASKVSASQSAPFKDKAAYTLRLFIASFIAQGGATSGENAVCKL